MSASTPSLKATQLSAVHRMLALNNEPPPEVSAGVSVSSSPADILKYHYPAGSAHNQWKILIYDTPCRSIISPLMSVSDLRARGVTLHLLLQSERECIPDVPAVYFVRPTAENLAIIAQDCAKNLYGCAHVNFVTKLPRDMMEDFARLVVQSNSLHKISSVHDQYLDYVCLERGLFSLNKAKSYVTYNGSTSETDIEMAMDEIAYGLFSVVATLGVVPVIRCPKSGAPEMVARKLNKMIAEHPNLTRQRKGAGGGGLHRPLLVILDRNEDLITPIQHTSTYQALIDDVLGHAANRVEFSVEDKAASDTPASKYRKKQPPQKKRYDLDPDTDPFYSSHKFNTFPEAIESNGRELQNVTEREAEVRSKTKGAAVVDENAAGTDLATAVDSLPALLDRKKQLEVHTSILQAVMNEVASRDIPTFYELESSLATGTYKSDLTKAKKDVTDMVSDASKGNIQDKIRLICVFCLATTSPSSAIDEVIEAARIGLIGTGTAGPEKMDEFERGVQAVQYLKKLRSMHLLPTMGESALQQGGGGADSAPPSGGVPQGGDMLSSFMARAATGLLAKAAEKVGTMLGKIHKHHATRVVENLSEFRVGTEDESYLYLDPKVKGDVDVKQLRGVRAPVRDAIAFVVGGGCYAEFQNLQMISNERRSIAYGSTELVDPCVFLTQLGELA